MGSFNLVLSSALLCLIVTVFASQKANKDDITCKKTGPRNVPIENDPCKSTKDCYPIPDVVDDSGTEYDVPYDLYCKKVTPGGAEGVCTKCNYRDFRIQQSQTDLPNYDDQFSLLMFSDIQYGLTTCHADPLEQCILHGCQRDVESSCSDRIESAAEKQIACVNNLYGSEELKSVAALFDIGDITHANYDELVSNPLGPIDNFYKDAKIATSEDSNTPFLLCMGNHDYATTPFFMNDTFRLQKIEYFISLIGELDETKKLVIRNVDLKTYTAGSKTTQSSKEEIFYQGSMAYSVEMGPHVFIMTHYAIDMTGNLFETQFQLDVSEESSRFVDIPFGEEWIKNEIIDANNEGKNIYLVVHAFNGLKEYVKGLQRDNDEDNSCDLASDTNDYSDCSLRDVILQSNIQGVFTGHEHSIYGYQGENAWEDDDLNHIGVYFATSNSYQKFLTVNMFKDGIAGTQVWDTSTDPCTKSDTYPSSENQARTAEMKNKCS